MDFKVKTGKDQRVIAFTSLALSYFSSITFEKGIFKTIFIFRSETIERRKIILRLIK